jgi:hypothetical protein
LRAHAPFTVFGAITGVVIMILFQRAPAKLSHAIFYTLHPVHVFLSALVTAAMYGLHECEYVSGKCLRGKCNFWLLIVIGYAGSVGIATLSDCLIPYLGEVLLDMPDRKLHIGFIEKWWLVNPLAFLGIAAAYVRPRTKFPHAGHVLLSTWASLFHMIMAIGATVYWYTYPVVAVFLFIAVWVPCCVSDIVFPLLFVGKAKEGNRRRR